MKQPTTIILIAPPGSQAQFGFNLYLDCYDDNSLSITFDSGRPIGEHAEVMRVWLLPLKPFKPASGAATARSAIDKFCLDFVDQLKRQFVNNHKWRH